MNNQQPQTNPQVYQQPPQMQNFQAPKPQKKKVKAWQIVLIVIGIIIVISAIARVGSESEDSEKGSSSVPDSSKTVSVSEEDYQAEDYLIVYNNQSEYNGKKVKLCGKINSIGTNISNVTYITFKEGISGLTGEVYCKLADSEGEKAKSQYKEGDYVEIGGKVGSFTLKTLNIDECYVFLSGDIVKKKIDEYQKQSEEKEASKQKEASAAVLQSKKDYIKECQSYEYKDIARNPKDYEGKKAEFEGKVVQVVEGGSNRVTLRVNVTKEKNEFAEGGYLYDDTVYVEYTRKNDTESRILEDDVIKMYGVLNGTKSYDSLLSGNITIPYLLAEYIDIVSE